MMYNTIQKSNSAPHKKQQRAWTEQELELLCERYYFEEQVNHCKQRLIIRRSQFGRKLTR